MEWFRRLTSSLRLRHRLVISLSVFALVPIMIASWIAVSVILRGLDQGLAQSTDRQLRVGLNLLQRRVYGVGLEATRLAREGELFLALGQGRGAIQEYLSARSPYMSAAFVHIVDQYGQMIAGRQVGKYRGPAAQELVSLDPGTTFLGLLEPRVEIVPIGAGLVVRAVAPILDEGGGVLGWGIVSESIGIEMAREVKQALGTEVILFSRMSSKSVASSFGRLPSGNGPAIDVVDSVSKQVYQGDVLLKNQDLFQGQYTVGYAPLVNASEDIVGMFAVAVDRKAVISAKAAATRTLALGAVGAFIFALILAGWLSRRITRPIAKLHQGALAVARGDLEHTMEVPAGDEIGDLAAAFSDMTTSLKENQARLGARMRELVALHEASRALSSEIDLEQVLGKIVDSVVRVLDVRVCALWVAESREESEVNRLRLGAVRVRLPGQRVTVSGQQGAQQIRWLAQFAQEVARQRSVRRVDRVEENEALRTAAKQADIRGALLAAPLEHKGAVVGVIVIGRGIDGMPFSDADVNLVTTFADQAAAAVEHGRLYEEVRVFSEELEAKVKLRTSELTSINAELQRTITELRDTQSQLVLSERLAGLGLLVAGVAHDINSPSAAIQGSVVSLAETVRRLTAMAGRLTEVGLDGQRWRQFVALAQEKGAALAQLPVPPPAQVRRRSRELAKQLESVGVSEGSAANNARRIVELAAPDTFVDQMVELIGGKDAMGSPELRADVLVGYITEYVYLHRSAATIRNAIERIQRIVGSLKRYSHLDQKAAMVYVDIHEGIENTLIILDHVLRAITVRRRFGTIPKIPLYPDELNQVWTNLIHNAAQALRGQGTIVLETKRDRDGVVVRITDDGPGIPEEVMPNIFDPFFTTKSKGEGTGLGLGIVQQIVAKHRGRISCESKPGCTCFEIWLPGELLESQEPPMVRSQDGEKEE